MTLCALIKLLVFKLYGTFFSPIILFLLIRDHFYKICGTFYEAHLSKIHIAVTLQIVFFYYCVCGIGKYINYFLILESDDNYSLLRVYVHYLKLMLTSPCSEHLPYLPYVFGHVIITFILC